MGERPTIVIAGAGIGGLTAALSVAEAGFHVVIVERSAELLEIGAGIQLSPNAGRVLAALGLEDAIAAAAIEPVAIEVRNGSSGASLLSIPVAAFAARYGFPYRVIHRADLQTVLAAAVRRRPDIRLILGARIDDVLARDDGLFIRARRTDGNEVLAAAGIVGADGVWSETRARLAGSRAGDADRPDGVADGDPDRQRARLARHRPGRPLAGAKGASRPLSGRPWCCGQCRRHRRGSLRQAGLGGAGRLPLRRRTLPRLVSRGARPRQRAKPMAEIRHQRRRPLRSLGRGPDRPPRRCRPRHGAVPGAGRGDGDRGRRRPRPGACARARTTSPRPSPPTRRSGNRAWRQVWKAARRTGDHYHQTGFMAAARDFILRTAGPKFLLGRNDWIYRWRRSGRERHNPDSDAEGSGAPRGPGDAIGFVPGMNRGWRALPSVGRDYPPGLPGLSTRR